MINLENSIERIRDLLADEDSLEHLRQELDGYHSADLADIFLELKSDERLACFQLIEEEKAVDLLEYLSPQIQVEILGEIDETHASRLISKMPHDEAADVLGDMEEDESETYLDKLPHKFSNELRELLKYDEDTAGGLMTPLVLTVNSDMTVDSVLKTIRIKAEKDNMDLYYVYVVDKQNHLLGVVSLRTLLTSPITQNISDIMSRDIVKLHVDDYRDYIADTFMKYQFNALPVVDLYDRLKGIVTWDDAQDVIEEETTDEIYASSGIATEVVEDNILSGSIINAVKARTPWLFITLLGEFLAVYVANRFDHAIQALPIIAVFIPLLVGLGGNIGTQSITLMVRGLSTGEVTLSTALHHVFRETFIGLLIGCIFGFLVIITTWGWQRNFELGFIVGLAMAINMMLATIIGTVTPFALKKIKIDPAVASGPVITTAIDVIGLAVYFVLVSAYLFECRTV